MDNVAEYRSPVRLVEQASEPVAPYTAQAISRTKKKLLAEMALEETDLLLDDVSYTRNDVLTLLDGAANETAWQHHCTVYAHPALLDFLEFEVFDAEGFKALEPLLRNESFAAFLSPYFSFSFNSAAGRMLKKNDFEGISCLLNYRAFILPQHSHEAYQRIRIYLDELVHVLKNMNWEKYKKDRTVLSFLFDGCWISFVNKLPHDFALVRDEVVNQMLYVIERFQHKATWEFLHECCLYLRQIECSERNRAEVKRFENIMRDNIPYDNKRTGNISPGRLIFLIIWVIISLARIGSCDSSSDKFDFSSFDRVNALQSPAALSMKEQNQQGFKNFLMRMNDSALQGKNVLIENGECPFYQFSTLPENTGPAWITIRNNTPYDCVLFYFHTHESDDSKTPMSKALHTVYVRKGSQYSFGTDAGKGPLNFLFGNNWQKLSHPQAFIPAPDSYLSDSSLHKYVSNDTLSVDHFFASTFSENFLKQDLLVSDYKVTDQTLGAALLHAPDSTAGGKQHIQNLEIIFTQQGDSIAATGSGALYLFQSSR